MYLGHGHATLHVLFIGKHNEYRAGELLLAQHVQQFILRNANAVTVRRINHIDNGVCIAVIATPVRSRKKNVFKYFSRKMLSILVY